MTASYSSSEKELDSDPDAGGPGVPPGHTGQRPVPPSESKTLSERLYLLAFHLGPVQDFIATARRTQDWWMGSWLLSHLSRTAIEAAQGKKACLVLPKELAKGEDPTVADVPNHFLARLTDEGPVDTAHRVEIAARGEWFRIGQAVKDTFFNRVDQSLWTRQVGTFLEIYWVLVPDDSDTAARYRAQTALDARKRLRDFCPTDEPHQKCTLCGARQELSGNTSVREARVWWQRLVKSHHGQLRIREDGSERLCAVCTVKRTALAAKAVPLHRDDGHFPSTSSVAAARFKEALLKSATVEQVIQDHLTVLDAIGGKPQADRECLPVLARCPSVLPKSMIDEILARDGDLFYPETFREKRFLEEYPGARETILARLQKEYDSSEAEILRAFPISDEIARGAATLRTLYHAVEARPSKYFAALMMDGDHMGTFFGKATEAQAQDLSQRMSRFARTQAKEIVATHLGRLVYAGGDDALALLPLDQALPCARDLQKKFKEAVHGLTLPAGVKHLPTPSIGVALAHHTAPLDGILLAMQRAEKSAKRVYGRDALCVHVLKRSGEEVRVGTHWQYDGLDMVDLVTRVVTAFREGIFSMKFAYAVAAEARGLAGDKIPLPDEARTAALKRLSKRHCGKGKEQEAKNLAVELAIWSEGKQNNEPLGIEEVARWILLARFIASGGRDDE